MSLAREQNNEKWMKRELVINAVVLRTLIDKATIDIWLIYICTVLVFQYVLYSPIITVWKLVYVFTVNHPVIWRIEIHRKYTVVNKLFLARGMTLTISIAIACSFTSNFNPYFWKYLEKNYCGNVLFLATNLGWKNLISTICKYSYL